MTVGEILRELRPTPSDYIRTARQIEASAARELKSLNVAILATFTSDLLQPYLVVESAARGILANSYFAPFNQLEQQALDSESPLYRFRPDVVVVATRLEDVAPNLMDRFLTMSPPDIDAELGGVEMRLESLIRGLRRWTKAAILVLNYASPTFLAAGFADPSLEPSQSFLVQQANERVAAICRRFSSVYVFDYARMVYEFGLRRWYDPKLLYLGRIPFGAEAQLATGRRLARYLRAICYPPCKCLVLDLDNTLWGGVLGEEGIGGIALGEDYPGNVYKDFQRKLLSLRDRGVLLAVASKNNESDVLEVFRKHPDCLLKAEDFAALQIHWEDKAKSLAAIARELNISTDALAFFDDNPLEREWIRSQMPEVTVIEAPSSPLDFASALDESGAFDHLSISEEDLTRSEMYRREQERTSLRARTATLEEFLQQLKMEVTIGHINQETLPRVAQLLAKTNQFNLTTRRHSASELEALSESSAVALWLRVKDRFGEHGLVGVAIGMPGESGQWVIDTFLLSCRVFGRHVETALLSVLSRIVHERGGQVLIGEYIPTPKNGLVSEFYPNHGFEVVDGNRKLWRWELARGEVAIPGFMELTFEDVTA